MFWTDVFFLVRSCFSLTSSCRAVFSFFVAACWLLLLLHYMPVWQVGCNFHLIGPECCFCFARLWKYLTVSVSDKWIQVALLGCESISWRDLSWSVSCGGVHNEACIAFPDCEGIHDWRGGVGGGAELLCQVVKVFMKVSALLCQVVKVFMKVSALLCQVVKVAMIGARIALSGCDCVLEVAWVALSGWEHLWSGLNCFVRVGMFVKWPKLLCQVVDPFLSGLNCFVILGTYLWSGLSFWHACEVARPALSRCGHTCEVIWIALCLESICKEPSWSIRLQSSHFEWISFRPNDLGYVLRMTIIMTVI